MNFSSKIRKPVQGTRKCCYFQNFDASIEKRSFKVPKKSTKSFIKNIGDFLNKVPENATLVTS